MYITMEKDDNIIKIAQDLDSKKMYSFSNRLTNLFSEMSSVTNKEEYDEVNEKYKKLCEDLKKADAEIHDRIVKTSQFRWWDRMGDWFSGKVKGPDARRDRIERRVTQDPRTQGRQPGQPSESVSTYKAVLDAFNKKRVGEAINKFGQELATLSQNMRAAEEAVMDAREFATMIKQAAQSVIGYYKKARQPDAALLAEDMIDPVNAQLNEILAQLDYPRFDGTYAQAMGEASRIFPETYQKVVQNAERGYMPEDEEFDWGGRLDSDGDGTPDSEDPEPESPDAGGTAPEGAPAPEEAAPETFPVRRQRPGMGVEEGEYSTGTGLVTWYEDGSMEQMTPEQANSIRSDRTQIGPGEATEQGGVPATTSVSPENQQEAARLLEQGRKQQNSSPLSEYLTRLINNGERWKAAEILWAMREQARQEDAQWLRPFLEQLEQQGTFNQGPQQLTQGPGPAASGDEKKKLQDELETPPYQPGGTPREQTTRRLVDTLGPPGETPEEPQETQTTVSVSSFVSEELGIPVREDLEDDIDMSLQRGVVVDGREIKDKQEYVDYLRSELQAGQQGQPTMYDLLGTNANKAIGILLETTNGNLTNYDMIKDEIAEDLARMPEDRVNDLKTMEMPQERLQMILQIILNPLS